MKAAATILPVGAHPENYQTTPQEVVQHLVRLRAVGQFSVAQMNTGIAHILAQNGIEDGQKLDCGGYTVRVDDWNEMPTGLHPVIKFSDMPTSRNGRCPSCNDDRADGLVGEGDNRKVRCKCGVVYRRMMLQ